MTRVNTDLRLKAVLDILADLPGQRLGAADVLAAALDRVPQTATEAEPLSGGVSRGHRSLNTATARLVKAGWIAKSRTGWSITDEGQRARAAFGTAEALAEALAAGTPAPTKAAPSKAKAATAKARTTPARKRPAPASAAQPSPKKAAPSPVSAPAAPAPADVPGQPEAVALPGDFYSLVKGHGDWNPALDAAQMSFDAVDGLWKLAAELPAGRYAFKVALNRSWTENYGAFGVPDGANSEFEHAGGQVRFAYDHARRDVSVN